MVTILSVVSPEVIKAVETETPAEGIDTISGQFYEEKMSIELTNIIFR